MDSSSLKSSEEILKFLRKVKVPVSRCFPHNVFDTKRTKQDNDGHDLFCKHLMTGYVFSCTDTISLFALYLTNLAKLVRCGVISTF